jgi:hypothetical protein
MNTRKYARYFVLAFGIHSATTLSGCVVSSDEDDRDRVSDEQAPPGFAGGKADDGSVSCAEQDPYVLTGVAAGGPNQGKCLDTTVYRAVRSLRGTEYVDAASRYEFDHAKQALAETGDALLASSRYALVANIRHGGEYWVAEIPLLSGVVTDVSYLVEEFGVPLPENMPPALMDLIEHYLPEEAEVMKSTGKYTAAHGMIRITLRDGSPAVLRRQFPADPSRTATVHELLLSVHGVSHVPGEYDIGLGMQDAFGTARGIFSLQERVDDAIGRQGNTIRQWRMALDDQTTRDVLMAYVDRSTDRGVSDPYNLFVRNCGSELFEALEETLGRTVGYDVRDLESIDEITPGSLVFPTLGRNYPKHAEQALVALQVLPLREGESPNAYGRVTHDQIEPEYRLPTLNEQVEAGAVRFD